VSRQRKKDTKGRVKCIRKKDHLYYKIRNVQYAREGWMMIKLFLCTSFGLFGKEKDTLIISG
jgi:hypothetical protein